MSYTPAAAAIVTTGDAVLSVGDVADGEFMRRVGGTVVGATASNQRTALGLGTAALAATGDFDAAGAATSAGATAVALSAQRASNLSDLASATTARSNLGLGTAAQQDVGAFAAATHAATHADGGVDEVSLDASQITSGTMATARLGGAGADATKFLRGDQTWQAVAGGLGTVTSVAQTVPPEFSVAGSPIILAGTLAITKATQNANKVWAGPVSGGDAQPAFRALVSDDVPTLAQAKVTNLVSDLAAKVPTTRTISTTAPLSGGGDLSGDRTLAVAAATTTATGVVELATDGESAANIVPQANDSRLSNARTPTAHAASHADGGSDEVAVDASQVTTGTVATARLGSGSANGSTFLRGDQTWAAPTASVAATTVERNLGSTPVFRGKFTITDAAISPTSKVLCWQAPGPYTGKGTRADEAEMQPVQVIAVEPASGSAVVKWQTPPMIVESPLLTSTSPMGGGTAANTGTNRDFQTTARRVGLVRGNVKFSYTVMA